MGHSIPVFYIPITKDELPRVLVDWHSAEELLKHKWENKQISRIRSITSRNWWFQKTVEILCNNLGINGLEFIGKELVYLETDEVKNALTGISSVIDAIKDGIPRLKPSDEAEGVIWHMRHDILKKATTEYSVEEYRDAYNNSKIDFDLWGSDTGYASIIDFFSYLRTLQDLLLECINEEKLLLCVQPQP